MSLLAAIARRAAAAASRLQIARRAAGASPLERATRFGPFEIDTDAPCRRRAGRASRALLVDGTPCRIRHRGAPVVTTADADAAPCHLEEIDAVAALAGTRPALLVRGRVAGGYTGCYLLSSEGDRVRTEFIGGLGELLRGYEMAAFAAG